MKDFKFYLEYTTKQDKKKATRKDLGNHTGNVIAVYQPTRIEQWYISKSYECFSGVLYIPNSPVNWGGVSPEFLTERCKLISEKQARQIHPALFQRLDEKDE